MYLDGAALTYCRRNNLVASANKAQASDKAEGAFVKQPTPGLYKWVYDLDVTSLYPMNMITLNISPETKYAKVLDYDEDEYTKGTDKVYNVELYKDLTAAGGFDDVFSIEPVDKQLKFKGSDELRNFIVTKNLSIASNGALYTMDKTGVIPAILKMWAVMRATVVLPLVPVIEVIGMRDGVPGGKSMSITGPATSRGVPSLGATCMRNPGAALTSQMAPPMDL